MLASSLDRWIFRRAGEVAANAKAEFAMSRVDGSCKAREAHGFRGCSDDVRTRLSLSTGHEPRQSGVGRANCNLAAFSSSAIARTRCKSPATTRFDANSTREDEKTPAKRRKRIVKCESGAGRGALTTFLHQNNGKAHVPNATAPSAKRERLCSPFLHHHFSTTTLAPHLSSRLLPSRPSPRPRLASVRLPPHILSHLTAAGTRCCRAEQSRPGSSHPSRDDSITSAFRQPTSRLHPSPDCMFMRHLQHNHA